MTSHPSDARPRPVADLFSADGRLIAIPRRRERRAALLAHLAETLFEPGRVYRETEVNEALRTVHDDHPALRRYLVTDGLLTRTRDGSAYHRQPTTPAPGGTAPTAA
ncbi:DUF2087 domain-containing protein [Streptomyces termitum]|uniref:DUF2087 domain-containing protein n=1 Tax=Streptomyces termitum TaxID=67368 RepID=A0A918SPI4_9ACTN|nr:DUF2087 domain-containing protein [Streptomyces termitum]GHA63952.1 hypothetical protein GCM10010305_01760 [Streptomyces termitum]